MFLMLNNPVLIYNSNFVKYYYNFTELFSILTYVQM